MGKTALLVLAAGMGSRFGGDKQLASAGPAGETILEYSVFDALRAGFDEVVFLIRASMEGDFRANVLPRLPAALKYRLAFQEPPAGRRKPWGTGHALLCASSAIEGPFAVANADDFYGRESFVLVRGFLASARPEAPSWCLAGYRLRNTTSPNGTVSRGICELDPSGRLLGIAEHRRIGVGAEGGLVSQREDGARLPLTGEEAVSMNLWGFTPAVFPLVRGEFRDFLARSPDSPSAEFGLPDAVGLLIAKGRARVDALPTDERWFGLTYREDFAEVAARLAELHARGLYPSPLRAPSEASSPGRSTGLPNSHPCP